MSNTPNSGAERANTLGRKVVDVSSFLVFFVLLAILSVYLFEAYAERTPAQRIAWPFVALPIALLISDLLSGIVHFLADNYGSEGTPFVGKRFCKPFRDHHVDPKGITRRGFIEANANTCILSLLPLAIVVWLGPYETGPAAFGATLGALILITVIMTNQFHKWAHVDHPPRPVAALQRWGVILTKDNHDLHHIAPYDTYYCITTGWLNPLFDRLGVLKVEASAAREKTEAQSQSRE